MNQPLVPLFVSYCREDRTTTEFFARELRNKGFEPWIDFEGILGGETWQQSILSALRRSFAVVVVMTPHSVGSKWVRYEIQKAKELDRPILPLLFETCEISEELEAIQYIDFRSGIDAAFQQLQKALIHAVVRSSASTLAPRNYDFVREGLLNKDEVVRATAAGLLTKLGTPDDIPLLLTLILNDTDIRVCESAANALVHIGGERAFLALVATITEGNPETAKVSVRALSKLNHSETVTAIIEAAGKRSEVDVLLQFEQELEKIDGEDLENALNFVRQRRVKLEKNSGQEKTDYGSSKPLIKILIIEDDRESAEVI